MWVLYGRAISSSSRLPLSHHSSFTGCSPSISPLFTLDPAVAFGPSRWGEGEAGGEPTPQPPYLLCSSKSFSKDMKCNDCDVCKSGRHKLDLIGIYEVTQKGAVERLQKILAKYDFCQGWYNVIGCHTWWI